MKVYTFGGNLNTISCAFRFRIYDKNTYEKIKGLTEGLKEDCKEVEK